MLGANFHGACVGKKYHESLSILVVADIVFVKHFIEGLFMLLFFFSICGIRFGKNFSGVPKSPKSLPRHKLIIWLILNSYFISCCANHNVYSLLKV